MLHVFSDEEDLDEDSMEEEEEAVVNVKPPTKVSLLLGNHAYLLLYWVGRTDKYQSLIGFYAR